MAPLFLTSLIFFSFFTISSPILPFPDRVTQVVETLSDSGFVSMALTLRLVSQTLIPQSSPATLFSPSDAAFSRSGQPLLNLLRFHFLPLKISPENLRSLTLGTKIPTLFLNHSLTVTTSAPGGEISLNNVKINGSAIYNDGSLVIYGIDEFFDPSFQFSPILAPEPDSRLIIGCAAPSSDDFVSGTSSLSAASDLLDSRGFSVMASFLDLQLLGSVDQTKFTVLAPVDEVIEEHLENFRDYSSIFARHLLPCKLTWTDMLKFTDGTILQTFSEEFTIKVTRSGDVLALNGVPVIFPDMYSSDQLVIHGLRQMLTSPGKQEETGDSFSEFNGSDEDAALDYGEFVGG